MNLANTNNKINKKTFLLHMKSTLQQTLVEKIHFFLIFKSKIVLKNNEAIGSLMAATAIPN
jgi:hypothetical protein